MSYILDALRKSESERQQGRIPDLGQQVQLIHRPKKKRVPSGVWIGLGLALNAAVLGLVFWPGSGLNPYVTGDPQATLVEPEPGVDPANASSASGKAAEVPSTQATAVQASAGSGVQASLTEDVPESIGGDIDGSQDRPTVIVPSPNTTMPPGYSSRPYGDLSDSTERVPHLVELPMSFQRRVPTLIFNSHVYASDPAARRVIINDHYLRIGDTFSGIRIDRITENGVELSMDGQRFRVGVVRDWISPQ